MKPWLRYSICILLGLAGGTVYAVHQVRGADMGRQVTNGPWSANTDQGTADASALTRARVALFGLLALPAKEAMYFIARTDSEGKPLDGRCIYTVNGGELDARWWSITLYKGEGWLVKNEANRWSVGGNAPERDANGNWSFTVSPQSVDGVWLPTGRTPQFDLTLRTYHPKGALLNDPAKAKLPTIKRETCA
ncbi:DUF1214 domain-containing protein [uncultured Sphingorhabdus sp.]|uniref:DUF1214 domain-containing protein n=1 Tax=uncultured Sphingorhabdus sp. TaxID=1686106 RepID=UPI00261762BF|nr:DUF1214 domain-containing protein [uncultured Sphingorhabdus sp.]HMS20249.1 DUF1214 domain-containing protein [Sphingorhabdus sp.]